MVTNSLTFQVANAVAAAITRQGASKGSVSVGTGISLRVLNRKLNGEVDFTVGELDAIAGHLGVDPKDFIPWFFVNREVSA